jgi:hypothetical protein
MGGAFAVRFFWIRLWQHQDSRVWQPWAFLFLRHTVVLVFVSWVARALPQYARSIAPDFIWMEEAYCDRNTV